MICHQLSYQGSQEIISWHIVILSIRHVWHDIILVDLSISRHQNYSLLLGPQVLLLLSLLLLIGLSSDAFSYFIKLWVIVRSRYHSRLGICKSIFGLNLFNYSSIHRWFQSSSLHFYLGKTLFEASIKWNSGFSSARHHRSPFTRVFSIVIDQHI